MIPPRRRRRDGRSMVRQRSSVSSKVAARLRLAVGLAAGVLSITLFARMGAPPPAAILIGIATGFGLNRLLAAIHRGIDWADSADTAPDAGDQPAQPSHLSIMDAAAPDRDQIAAAAGVAQGEMGERLRRMLANVRLVEERLRADPSRLSLVQRLFTYYLPATAQLLHALGAMGANGDAARVAEIESMIGKLDEAFDDFAKRAQGLDARAVSIDLKLLEQSLADEFDRAR